MEFCPNCQGIKPFYIEDYYDYGRRIKRCRECNFTIGFIEIPEINIIINELNFYKEKFYEVELEDDKDRYKSRESSNAYQRNWRKNKHGMSLHLLHAVKRITKNEGFEECNITSEWIEEALEKGCELTGIPFRYGVNWDVFGPSVDRIDNDRGYVTGNVRLILRGLNSFKGMGTDDDIYFIANKLLENKSEE